MNHIGAKFARRNDGAITNDGVSTGNIRNCTISDNVANRQGGNIHDPINRLQIANATLRGGAASFGGGIFVAAGANGGGSIVNTIIAGNTAINGGSDVSGAFTSLGHNLSRPARDVLSSYLAI